MLPSASSVLQSLHQGDPGEPTRLLLKLGCSLGPHIFPHGLMGNLGTEGDAGTPQSIAAFPERLLSTAPH